MIHTTEGKIRSFDGIGLYFKTDAPDAPRAVVVIVHGLCEHQGRYEYVASRLCEGGLAVCRFDHRGHGRSDGKRAYCGDFNDLVDDVFAAVSAARTAFPGLPLFLLGHDMGGFAAALFGCRNAGQAEGIVTAGALTRNNAHLALGLPASLPDDTYVPNALGSGACSDPAVSAAYEADPIVEKHISAGLFRQLLAGVRWLEMNLGQFTDPVLILHGACDGIVSERDSREFFGMVSSKDRSLRIYSGLLHEILNEPDRGEVLADIIRWIDRRSAR